MKKDAIGCLLLLAATLLFLTQPMRAEVSGIVLGTVTDSTGAVVPRATVTLRNPKNGLNRHVTTDAVGSYEFLAVPVGEDYVVEVQLKGFSLSSQSGIKVLVNQRFRADLSLAVGGVTQNVTVQAAPAQVESTTTQLGDVIEDKKMTTLPLNGRSYIDLLGLQTGVVPITSSNLTGYLDTAVSGDLPAGNFSVNGQRENGNSFLVNGGDVEESKNSGASIIPVLDSIQEFRILTNSFDAEYGRFSGAIVNVITKSGNNEFHGSGFEFLRNQKLDSRNFFDYNQTDPTTGAEIPGSAIGVFRRNQFGGTIGGPILKNRLFFFGDYQGTRETRGASTGLESVPSLLNRTGDFSDANATGSTELTGIVRGDNIPNNGSMDEVLTSKLGYQVVSGEPYWTPGCNSPAQAQAGMCVFPGQVIPQSVWSPVAKDTMQFVPSPTGQAGGVPFFETTSAPISLRDDKFGTRIDLPTQRTGTWSAYYHFDDAIFVNPYARDTVPGFNSITPSRSQQFNVSNTLSIGSGAVNEARINFTRFSHTLNQPGGGLGDITKFGFVKGGLGILPVDPALEGAPTQIIAGNYWLYFGLPENTTGQFDNTFQLQDNYSRIVGKHTLKFGGDGRYFQVNERNLYATNGRFQYKGQETGNSFADFLLGAPNQFIQSSPQSLDSRSKYTAAYAQDSFKVRPNFTVNYGLRWEASEPFYDTQNRLYDFIPGKQSTTYPDAPTGYVFAGDPGVPRTLSHTHYNNFGPRLGLAYSPGFTDGPLAKIFGGPGKTSIRAASGIYYTAVEDLGLFFEVGGAPFGLFYVSPTQVYADQPYKARQGSDPGQRFPFTNPAPGATGIWPQYLPISSSPMVEPNNVLPYAEHFNFTVQREISKGMIWSLGYVGTRGHHLPAQQSFNPGSASVCLHVASVLTAQGNAGQACGPYGEDATYNLGGGQMQYGTRPYSVTSGRSLSQGLLDFQDNDFMATMANSNYNAFETSIEKKIGAVRLLAAYTYSKSLDNSSNDTEFVNAFNSRISKSLSDFDMTHNFVVSYSYDLPFNRLFRSHSTGVRSRLVDGWTATGITRFTTGLPVSMSDNSDNSLCGCSGVDLPNYNGQAIQVSNPRASATHQYFSTDAFSMETLGVAGNANRAFFHGPGLNNWDFALHKTTRVTERVSVEFRAEFFNVFNHAQFTNPNGTVESSAFGAITGALDPRIGQMALKLQF